MAIRKISDLPPKTYDDIAPRGNTTAEEGSQKYKEEQGKLSVSLVEISYPKQSDAPFNFESFSLDYATLRKDINEQIIGRDDHPEGEKVTVDFYKIPIFNDGQISVLQGMALTGNVDINQGVTNSGNANIAFTESNINITTKNSIINNNILSIDRLEVYGIGDKQTSYYSKFYKNSGDKIIDIGAKLNLNNNISVNGTTNIDFGQNTQVNFHGVASFDNVIQGCALCAKWADLAEGYESDKEYEPGTLVKFGGEKEITIADTEANAVITTSPGLILGGNNKFEIKQNIALVGRVPVRVLGNVSKFEELVLSESTPGVAQGKRRARQQTIGRALQDVTDNEGKITKVEAVVKLVL